MLELGSGVGLRGVCAALRLFHRVVLGHFFVVSRIELAEMLVRFCTTHPSISANQHILEPQTLNRPPSKP